jgi:hypothetical protein
MHLFVEAAESMDDPLKSLVALFLTFTGVRADTLCHLHSSWFGYDEGALKIKIPAEDSCTKTPGDDICGRCREKGKDGFSPKTGAGEGRTLKIPESWHNRYTDESGQQPLDLRERIEHHFAIDGGPGHDVIDGDGLSPKTPNTYVKEIATDADIGFLRPTGYTSHNRLGRVPDIVPHDLRGTYCVQLARNDANPWKMCKKTGHSDIESLKPYIQFAEQEFDGDFEEEHI